MFSRWTMMSLLLLGLARVAHADPPNNILIGVRLYLTTTTIPLDHIYSSTTENGFTRTYSSRNKGQVQLKSKVLEGYVYWSSMDPPLTITSATTAGDVGVMGRSIFAFETDLVQLKHPRPVVVNPGSLQGLFIPTGLIQRVEKFKGRFDGYTAYGEPFFIPGWQARLMSDNPPVYTCVPPTERQEVVWVSYNPEVGEKEMQSLCDSVDWSPEKVEPIIKRGNVFAVVYPAD